MSDVNKTNPYYYYINPDTHYTKSKPHPTNNLIELYSLNAIASSVARMNQGGSKGVKLRKSYKAHITELPGIKTEFSKDHTVSPIVFAPEREGAPIDIKQFDEAALSTLLKFDKTSDNGLYGFDVTKLGLGDLNATGNKRKQKSASAGVEDVKRRKLDQ